MTTDLDDTALLARFLRILGDRNRLAIVGLVAARPRTPADLRAELPSLTATEMERHLNLLTEAECVEAAPDDAWRLDANLIPALRAALARLDALPSQPAESTEAVVRAYFDREGRLRSLPEDPVRRGIVLRHLARLWQGAETMYNEEELSALLTRVHDDPLALKAALLDFGLLQTRADRYWLTC